MQFIEHSSKIALVDKKQSDPKSKEDVQKKKDHPFITDQTKTRARPTKNKVKLDESVDEAKEKKSKVAVELASKTGTNMAQQ